MQQEISKKKIKAYVISFLKLAIVGGLFFWMIQGDKLHLSELKLFVTNPSLLAATIGLWCFGPVFLGSLRWYLLLRGVGVECTYGRAVYLTLIGFAFNTSMPGAVSGDIIKAVYIVKDQKEPLGKTPAMLSVLLDRIMGLMGLFLIGLIASLTNFESLWANPVTRSLVTFLFLIVAGVMTFLALVYSPHKDKHDPLLKLLNKNFPGFGTLKKIYVALRSYRKSPKTIIYTLFLSMLLQVASFYYMAFVYETLNGEMPPLSLLASVFPFGILVTAIPIAPGGLGVGHVAFDRLFNIVGLQNGANVFNLFALGPLALNLLGFIPYLLVKKRPLPTEEEMIRQTI